MSDPVATDSLDYRRGRSAGLALGAFAMALLAFVNLLSLEKALLAAALAVLALRGADGAGPGRRWAVIALVLAGLYAATWITAMVLLREELAELLRLLQQLG